MAKQQPSLKELSDQFQAQVIQLNQTANQLAAALVLERDQRDVSDNLFKQVEEFKDFWSEGQDEIHDWGHSLTDMILCARKL